jgi:hypothetical protein
MSRQLRPLPKLERDVAIYLAGLIDGEACFFISNSAKHSRYSTKIYHTPEFKLVLTDEPVIAWIAEQLNLTYGHAKGRADKNHKDTYEIRIAKVDILIDFIPQILPFLRVKRAVAVMLLDFCESRQQERQTSYHAKYTVAELILANGIRELNRVGILDRKERIVS